MAEPRRSTTPLAAAAAAAAALPFLPALRNGFVNFEDYYLILDNPPLRSLSPASLAWMARSVSHGAYQPLGWLAYAALLGAGAGAAAFHLAGLALHAASAAALFLVTRELLLLSGAADDARARLCALAGALLWAVHPMHVESVAWASSIPDALAVLLAILSVGAYLARERRGAPRGAWLAASLALFGLSLLAHWRACFGLPVLLLALDAYPLRRRAFLEKVPYAALSAAAVAANFAAKRALVSAGAPALRAASLHPGWPRALLFYLWKLPFPAPLRVWYSMDGNADLPLPAWACAALLGAAALWLWRGRRRRPAAAVAGAFYLASIAPVAASFSPTLELAAANHYVYFSWLWLAPLAATGLLSARPAARRALAAAVALWLAFAGAWTWRETGFWRDSVTLWERVLALGRAPYYARPNYAQALLAEGRFDDATAALEEQTRLFPGDAHARELLSRVRADPRAREGARP